MLHKLPVHKLGIGSIFSYGFLFYLFAPVKPYLSYFLETSETSILLILTINLLIQAAIMPIIGKYIDKFGGLKVMRIGFIIGSIGICCLGLIELNYIYFQNFFWLSLCLILISTSLSMCGYECSFSTVIQLDEKNSRKNISIITFYGGIASTITWLCIFPLIDIYNLLISCLIISSLLLIYSFIINYEIKNHTHLKIQKNKFTKFNFFKLDIKQRLIFLILSVSNFLNVLVFASLTLFWINWFSEIYENPSLAIILASIYGPFQTIGRLIEMFFGSKFDARITGTIGCIITAISLIFVQFDNIYFSILSMILFGMGHGVITVTFGFVTNLYFDAKIYGQAKSLIASTSNIAMAIGPSLGSFLYFYSGYLMFTSMLVIKIIMTLMFALLIIFEPTNAIHKKHIKFHRK